MTPSPATTSPIRAAGGLLWRRSPQGEEVAVVHRRRHDDWTLPKGKLEDGETWRAAALREVKEETGHAAEILAFAGAIAYETAAGPKVVRYWHMRVAGGGPSPLDDEVREVVWLTPSLARQRLQYPLEQALLAEAEPPFDDREPIRPSPLARWREAWRRAWFAFWVTRARAGLRTHIEHLELSLGSRAGSQDPWTERARSLLVKAREALAVGDAERGWVLVKAARRETLHTLDGELLEREARVIVAEAKADLKAGWRCDGVGHLLAAPAQGPLPVESVIRARQILDDHHDNVYRRIGIVTARLTWLNIWCAVILGLWIWRLPLEPGQFADPAGSARRFWLAILATGFLGALVSGFLSSIGSDPKASRIPAEVFGSTLVFARLFVGVASAVAVTVFLISGTFATLQPSYGVALAAAFVAGFSDRLLLRAVGAFKSA